MLVLSYIARICFVKERNRFRTRHPSLPRSTIGRAQHSVLRKLDSHSPPPATVEHFSRTRMNCFTSSRVAEPLGIEASVPSGFSLTECFGILFSISGCSILNKRLPFPNGSSGRICGQFAALPKRKGAFAGRSCLRCRGEPWLFESAREGDVLCEPQGHWPASSGPRCGASRTAEVASKKGKAVDHSSFGRSEHRASEGSLSLRACLRAQLAVTSAVNANSFSLRSYRLIRSASRYLAPPLRALDAQHVELADQVAKMIAPSRGVAARVLSPPTPGGSTER
jgi:hypothetical protein